MHLPPTSDRQAQRSVQHEQQARQQALLTAPWDTSGKNEMGSQDLLKPLRGSAGALSRGVPWGSTQQEAHLACTNMEAERTSPEPAAPVPDFWRPRKSALRS